MHLEKEIELLSASMKKMLGNFEILRADLSYEIATRRNQVPQFQAMVQLLQENMDRRFHELCNAGEIVGLSLRQSAEGWNGQINILHDSYEMLEQRLGNLEFVVLLS